MTEKPGKILSHDKMNGNCQTNASELIDNNELPLLMSCKCSNAEFPVHAQLMRLHVVTPKAPIRVTLNPQIKAYF